MISKDKTVYVQYADSPALLAVLDSIHDALDPSDDIDSFFSTIWDIDTAETKGLDIWGRIVNVSRRLLVTGNVVYLGFQEASTSSDSSDSGAQPFGYGTFYAGTLTTNSYDLPDEAYRKLILVKAMSNICNCAVPTLNSLLNYLFSDRGKAFVQDVGEMQIRYVFLFTLSAVEKAIVTQSGAMPRPSGVLLSMMTIDPDTTLGFSGSNMQPFGQGVFFNQNGISYAS